MRPCVIVSLGVLAFCGAARAAAPEAVEVRAAIRGDRLEGTWQASVELSEGEQGLRLWLYGDRLARRPSAMNDGNARWIFPREVDLSEVAVSGVRVDGQPVSARFEVAPDDSRRAREFAGRDLFIPMPPGRHRVELRFSQRLPERFGRLGRVGSRITLTAPWYPLVLEGEQPSRAADGYAFDIEHDVRLCVDEGRELLLGSVRADSGVADVRCARATASGAFVPAVAAPTLHERRRVVSEDDPRENRPSAVALDVVSATPLYRAPADTAQGLEQLNDISRVDVVGHIEGVTRDVLRTLRAANIAIRPGPLHVVLTPSRTELAATAPGWVVVSDRLYEIFPLRDVRALHDRALARALFAYFVEPLARVDPLTDRGWAADVRAALLTDLDSVRRDGDVTTTEDLIGWAGFNPIVDQLLYAPQVAFVDVFFGSVAEPDPFRETPWRARRPTARGRRILEHARDLMDEDDFRAWSRALLAGERGAREALVHLDSAAASRLPQWLDSPGLEVNYRLGAVSSVQTPDGYEHRVEVFRTGAARVEPVEVRVVDRDGNRVTEIWDGVGRSVGEDTTRGEVVIETPAARRSVHVDPRGRLPQSARLADGHPLRDDTDTLSFRPPILQNVGISGSATERNVTGLLDVVVRRRYDLENTFGVRLTVDPRSYGGILRYVRGVGRKRDNNSRRGFVSLGLEVDRLRASFSADGQGGWRAGGLLVGGYSDQRFFLDPRSGRALVGSLRGGVVLRDDGSTSVTVAPGVRGNYTMPLGLRGALVMVGAVSWVFGAPLPSELPGLGGRFLLRGYQSDEVVGRGRAFAVVEARFTPTAWSDLAWNGLHLVWVRELQLALFTGAGLVVDANDGRDVAFGAEVGGGLRVHFDYGGIQPAVLALDLAVPLVRDARARQARAPVTFVLGFEQYF